MMGDAPLDPAHKPSFSRQCKAWASQNKSGRGDVPVRAPLLPAHPLARGLARDLVQLAVRPPKVRPRRAVGQRLDLRPGRWWSGPRRRSAQRPRRADRTAAGSGRFLGPPRARRGGAPASPRRSDGRLERFGSHPHPGVGRDTHRGPPSRRPPATPGGGVGRPTAPDALARFGLARRGPGWRPASERGAATQRPAHRRRLPCGRMPNGAAGTATPRHRVVDAGG
jgi:hypothetical protein